MPHATSRTAPLSGGALLIGLSAYAVCLLLGFGFGWVAGARPGRPVEVAQNDRPADPSKPIEIKPSDVTLPDRTPKDTQPAGKKDVTRKETPNKTEPKKEPPEAVAMKPPEPKKEPPPPPKKEPAKTEVVASNLTFTKDVLPVFRKYCNDCHSGPKPKAGVDLSSLAMVMKGKKGQPILKPGDPAGSSVYTSVEDNSMPPEGKAPSDAEKKLIKDWIAGGAK